MFFFSVEVSDELEEQAAVKRSFWHGGGRPGRRRHRAGPKRSSLLIFSLFLTCFLPSFYFLQPKSRQEYKQSLDLQVERKEIPPWICFDSGSDSEYFTDSRPVRICVSQVVDFLRVWWRFGSWDRVVLCWNGWVLDREFRPSVHYCFLCVLLFFFFCVLQVYL